MITESEFHRSRQMFAVVNSRLKIALPDIPESHQEWFDRRGWGSIEGHLRGYTDKNRKHVSFYVDDFQATCLLRNEFFLHLPKLIECLGLHENTMIGGGEIPDESNVIWKPRRVYGTVGHYMKYPYY
ncbi:hypothetical protein COU62_04630 [Candidatus Pacearchaeota archaeon CG10_big_fil_rev_8_21_14_0_10_35_219]|nr:hypothetical protein [Candidatus Pacearchaeota archaeon]OIO41862.1 MAG: hypothetical protein AUJ63_04900 [Candidatus Pacearchaeota archaeon CG1_02_35_32]PIO07275.1 MAG: hypothetical protein COU62_04630 [Candidatus Pacearchaeota archaeon CG10_big_fil_rev_8_21_14_0_10_35_219]PIY81158.1 MAG: hypothetical protein COY79_03885 [Candidatus Pacearchaeota archaeon CG_4_10_14_0_8_um_filter_35_169]PIZ80017.1 MAG: hypothetical protein COY00_02540 [Candidatus Pacearchaeota archaeon CG_4_10_14_0_2_um_filt